MKKLFWVLVLSLVGCSVVFAAGQAGESTKPGASGVNPGGALPIVNQKISISVMAQEVSLVTDWNTNLYTQWLEEKTNVHADITNVPSDGIVNRLNLAIASGDLPDVFLGMPFKSDAIQLYGAQGVFRPLNDLIDRYGVEMRRLFAERPFVKKVITSLDGNIYGIPRINEAFHTTFDVKAWMYRPWLDKLGLPWPQTTDDLYKVLKAFKDRDPNGNGAADEIPFSGANISWASCDVEQYLMNSFLYNQRSTRLFVDKGTMVFGPTTAEWREGLRYIRKLYAENLIAPETFTQDSTQYARMGKSEPQILGVGLTAYPALFADFSAGKNGMNFYALPPMKGPNGVQYAGWDPFLPILQAQLVITSANKHPEATFRWGDFMLTDESTLRSVMGIEEIHWRKAKPGELNLENAQAARVRIVYPKGETPKIDKNYHWNQRGPSLRTGEWRDSWAADITQPRNGYEGILHTASRESYEPYIPDISVLVPPLSFDTSQATELVDLKTPILNYIKTMIAKFVVGEADVEKDWSNYIDELKKMGVDRYVEIYQKAYDSQY